MKLGDIVYLSDLKLPEGVEIPQLKLGKDHDDAVVIAKHGREESADDEAAEGGDVPASKVGDDK